MNTVDEACSDERAAFERRAKEWFDDGVERLDARTCSKLTQARNAAVDELQRVHGPGAPWHALRMLVPGLSGVGRAGMAASLGAALVAAVAVIAWQGDERNPVPGALPLDDLEIVADADSLEMLEEVEFYAWLNQP